MEFILYHRRFIEVARELYISKLKDKDRKIIFQNVVDLFTETWNGKNKPFKIDDPKLVKKYKLDQSNGEIQANRFTTSQPIEFIDFNGRIQYNKRKLNELPQFLIQLAPTIALPIAAEEMFFNYSFMHAKFSCSSFLDIESDLNQFQQVDIYGESDEVEIIHTELTLLFTTYMVFGHLLNQYPDNYAFELTSRLLTLYGLSPNITKLLKQCDEQSPRYCGFIVPYFQLQPPGHGLILSINKHTMPVVDLNLISNESAAISLSNKIIVIDMGSGDTVIDIKLPQLNEPYLNSTTLPNMIIHHTNQDMKIDIDDDDDDNDLHDTDDEDKEKFKHYTFFVNSFHHIYLVSSHGDIKFHQTSIKGYLIAEIINRKYGLCILVEQNSNSIQCWNLEQNKLFTKIDLSIKVSIKKVSCSKLNSLIISIILDDGFIHFYTFNNSTFIHRGIINAGKYLDQVIINKDKLICTFNSTIPIDFAYIDLNSLNQTQQIFLSDKDIVKVLIAFNPPIIPKPIERILLPDGKVKTNDESMKMFFIILTKEYLYIVHTCMKKDISYVRIPGQYDVVTIRAKSPYYIFTAKGGVVNIFKWECIEGEDDRHNRCNIYHKYQLFVSIEISSSPVLTIRTLSKYARGAFKNIPSFSRTKELIDTIQLSGTKAVTLGLSKQELTSWLYQHSTFIESKRLFTDSTKIDDYAVLSDTAVLVITNTYWAEVYALKSLNKEPIFRLHLHYSTRVFFIDENTFILITNDGSIRCITQQINKNNIKFNQTSNKQLNIKCSRLFTSILTLDSILSLIVLADDEHSLGIYRSNDIIYMNIDLSQYSSTRLLRMTSEKSEEFILFYFENKSLISCRIQLSTNKNSYHLIPFDTADIYCLKNNCLATVINDKNRLNLYNIHSCVCHESIQLENECEQLCLNESGDYVFALVKPRILCMYRVIDRFQLGRLFVYDFVTRMIVSNDFIVLAMNDRRLLTLMIADPDDSTLQTKIQALPSRQFKQDSHSTNDEVVKRIEKFMNVISDDSDSETENEQEMNDKQFEIYNKTKVIQPITSYRYVRRLNGKFSLEKMKTDESYRKIFFKTYIFNSEVVDSSNLVIDDSEIDDEDEDEINSSIEQEHNLDDIREKTLEYNRQQVKGIQLANAGANNLKIINSYSVTSSTCIII
ncbi:unnamed protein product [Rotaria sordida]|uniref:Uncharacterized protein n=1 Tax=Rotaria sordida TaxID=392033 RepID=A0A819V5A0_9BILA|nr:unnamed protein product [Rotaria sordida]